MKHLCGLVFFLFSAAASFAITLSSPDASIEGTFAIRDREDGKQCLVYSVRYHDTTIIQDSLIAFEIKEQMDLREHVSIQSVKRSSQNTTWKPVYGERSLIRDIYNSAVLEIQETSHFKRTFLLTVRAYNEGLAFCVTFPGQEDMKPFVIEKEKTEFRFLHDHPAWATYSAQGEYQQVPLSQIKDGCERPLTIKVSDDIYASLAEARMVDYARTKFAPHPTAPHCITTSLSGEVEVTAPFLTPWRVIMLAQSPGALLENNDIILNVNDPCAIEDTRWIRPGKVLRETSLTTKGGLAAVDFAVRHNFQYIEFDAGWYGHEYDDASDATTITVDPKRSPGPLDLQAVIAYADSHDIGVIVYVNRRALEKQLDVILPLYQSWGIKGVKYGFVNVGSQQWSRWLHEAVRKAARHQLMVDIHDEYRPTGYSRTYPNLMTQEGIRGDEAKPTNELTLAILFTRMIAGAGDNTICYYDQRVYDNANHAYQLAKAVCFYSPWQFMYWYDTPAEIEKENDPELEFNQYVPTVWDDTKVLFGEIGKHAVIARRSDEDWYIGCMTAGSEQTFSIPLNFLKAGTDYTAFRYLHDPKIQTRTHVRIDSTSVNQKTILQVTLDANSGEAIRIMAN
jgi:alpha-glucosidase